MKNKGKVFTWSLFDFANSTYATIIVAFVFAIYFKDVINGGLPSGDLYWAIAINLSMIISAVLNPVCGAIADLNSTKKKFLLFFTALSIICTALLYFTGEGTVILALALFILSNIGFQTGMTFYDAFIPEIADEKDYNKVSGVGYAVGYIGSLFSVFLVFPFKDNPQLLFAITAVVFLVFSLPLFLFLKEHKAARPKIEKTDIQYGLAKVKNTIKNINAFPNLKNFLFSFFFYIDAVNTIIFFSALFARSTLEFDITSLAIFFIIVQITAMLGSFLFGFIGDKIGLLKSLYINLVFWIAIILVIFFLVEKESFLTIAGSRVHLFFIVGGFAGLFLGSTQSISRTVMSKLTPFESKTEFFGFYALMDKTSTLLGPLTFGLVSSLSGGNQKLAVLSVGAFFIIGMLLLSKVKLQKEI